MLRLDGIWLEYPGGRQNGRPDRRPPALADVTFSVPAGGYRWLLGPSGAGKSSLLRVLHLTARPQRGRLEFLGHDVAGARRASLPRLRRQIGMVFQDFRLLPHLSAYDNVALPLRLAGRNDASIHADVVDLLGWVGLGTRMNAIPASLSGGEQQRVAIARAVIARPRLLLADEPTGNLDDVQAGRLMQLLQEMNRQGTTVIVATHSLALIDRHPAPILALAGGMLVQDGG